MRYIGFDMGDGESAVAAFEQFSGIEPVILPLCGVKSLLSAVGTVGGEIVIGERAYTDALADNLSVRFKSRFTEDVRSNEDVVRFVRGVLRELRDSGALKPDDRFVVGCPAGWNAACRLRYRDVLARAGVPEPQVISESRAAFLYAKYAKTVALDVDILNQSALVIDIGSSTLDFAYIVDGRETGVGTFGDTQLGGGLLDAELLRRAVEKSKDRETIKQVFAESRSWYSYCEIEARRVKEAYYTRLSSDPAPIVKKQLRLCYDGVQRLQIALDNAEAERIVYEPLASLGGRSFAEAIESALRNASRVTADNKPKLVLLTGGASRMPFFREMCRAEFPSAAVICCPEPEFSIAKGLAYAGWVDENLRAFRAAIQDEVSDERVSEAARQAMPELIPSMADALCDLLISEAALPVAQAWQRGEIDTLNRMNERMNERISMVLKSPMTREALAPSVEKWLISLTPKLQAMVDPICDRYEVPRKEMKLDLTASGSANNVTLSAKELMRFDAIGAVAGTVISVLVGFLCGGSGIALVASGPLGFLAGLLIGAVVSLFGWGAISNALMNANIPALMRRMDLKKRLCSDRTGAALRDGLISELGNADGEFQTRLVSEFSKTFRGYLYGVAQAAEIPIE